MNMPIKKPLAAALGAAFITSVSFTSPVSAEVNPFGVTELETGYMVLAEGKCGGMKAEKKAAETKCGEGKTSDMKTVKKAAEAKCGEGKCGDKK